MSEATEPSDEDVERLARLWYSDYDDFTEPMQRVYDDMARKALAAGVHLPPVPEPEAEPQERYRADGNGVFDDAKPGSGCFVITHGDDRHTQAPRIAHLLSLDDRYEGGVEAEVERLSELLAKARKFHTHTEQDRVNAEARVKELEAELAEARAKPRMMQSVWPAPHEGRTVDLAAEPDATGPTDTATEPLFTGKVQGRRSLVGMKHLDWVQITPVYREDFPLDRLDLNDLVDVYPHGARPAALTVTARMLDTALAGCVIGRYLTFDEGALTELALVVNRLLAEQGGEG
jgi:hypothetical protein